MSNDHLETTGSSDPNTNLLKYLPIVLNPDRTITRPIQIPSTAASPDPTSSSPVLTKDLALNPLHNTFVRLFLPRHALYNSAKLPLVVYFHGGGFILFSAASTIFHDFCCEMAVHAGVVIASVDYRLAPEHRLPAAYDDAMEALQWIKDSRDEWLTNFADFSNCFIMGESAGGNIAYHAGLRAAAVADELLPLKIKGLVLDEPGFGGSKRTGSELRLANDSRLPTFVLDLIWELSLPMGADRDHEYCNPTAESEPLYSFDKIRSLGWRVMVVGCHGDPMIDRQMELAERLEKKGVDVVAQFDVGGYHAVKLEDPEKAKQFFVILKKFVVDSCTTKL
uniref:Carboxylesterase 1 n=2 Tax=Actinidia eriantha TaxID=165200 RepID=CXE1_ACTER|nr:RecName: Full=Carboxylesterase 1; Short=AeCXE1 [Actinidia eriantha]ABB89013.1 CXE carboxylesterase [Actinidia eriantha]